MTMHVLEQKRGWVRMPDALALVAKSRATVNRWAAAGWVKTERVNGKVYFKVEHLLATEAALASGDTPEKHVTDQAKH